jgi:hypothetical protein
MDRIVQFDRRHGVASWIGHLRVLCWRSPRRLALYERFSDVRSVPDGSDGSPPPSLNARERSFSLSSSPAYHLGASAAAAFPAEDEAQQYNQLLGKGINLGNAPLEAPREGPGASP